MSYGSHIDREHASRMLAEAVVAGDKATCKKHKISRRTLWRYRKLLSDDPKLAELVVKKNEMADRDWAQDLPDAISKAIGFLSRAADSTNTNDPQMVHSVAGALKILSDVALARKLLDARMARSNGSPGETSQQGVPSGSVAKVVAIR